MSWTRLVKCAAEGRGWRLAAGLLAGAVTIGAPLLLPVEHHGDCGGPERKHMESQIYAPADSPFAKSETDDAPSLDHPL
jgi:hypothetical protein